jgi:predicted nuclease with TOPRIM domain
MSLTKGDLQAIKDLFDLSFDERVPPMFDQFEERLKIQIEAGLQEIRDRVDGLDDRFSGLENRFERLENRVDGLENKFAGLEHKVNGIQITVNRIETTVDSIERVQHVELERNDKQDAAIKKMHKALHAA